MKVFSDRNLSFTVYFIDSSIWYKVRHYLFSFSEHFNYFTSDVNEIIVKCVLLLLSGKIFHNLQNKIRPGPDFELLWPLC
jgi:hypothetical protein